MTSGSSLPVFSLPVSSLPVLSLPVSSLPVFSLPVSSLPILSLHSHTDPSIYRGMGDVSFGFAQCHVCR